MLASPSEAKPNNVFETTTGKRLLKTAVIFGANASGKTNIILFFYCLKRFIRHDGVKAGDDVYDYQPFKFDMDSRKKPVEFEINFITNDTVYYYNFTYDKNAIIKESLRYDSDEGQLLLFERIIKEGRHKIKFGTLQGEKKEFEVFANQPILSKFGNDTPHDFITPASTYLMNLNVTNAYHLDMLNTLREDVIKWIGNNQKRKDRLIELLKFADTGVNGFQIKKRDAVVENIVDIMVSHPLFENKIICKNSEELHFSYESYGTRNLFILGGKILQSLEEGTPIFIDELDSGFHTYISTFIIELFRNERINKKHSQLILTTHDVNLLDENVIRKDQIWFTEKDKYGASTLFSLQDFTDVKEDTFFKGWYLANKFGAVPAIQSLEKLFIEDE
jgi:AAA15 family ATPase/GTPase